MSDTSQGPGWWQASDGKWYSPEQAPGYVPPPPPTTGPPAQWQPNTAQPGQPGYVPQQTEKKKRKVWPWIAMGTVVVVIIIIAATSGSKKTNTTATTATPGAPAAAPTTTSASASGPGLNQVAKDGDFAFTVTGMQCGVTSVGSDPLAQTAPAGSQWCMVAMTVTNDKTGSQTFFASNQKAADASGRKLDADTAALIYMPNGSQAESTQLNPGVSINVTVPFNLSTSDSIKQVELHDSAFSNGVIVNVH